MHVQTTIRILIAALFCAGIGLPWNRAHAGPLAEILHSDEMDEVVRQTKNNELRIKRKKLDQHRWINPKSTFGKLFIKNNQAHHMVGWLVVDTGDYDVRKTVGLKGKTYAYAEARLKKKDAPTIFLRVLVPHPKYVEMMLYGLLPDFNELVPPDARLVLKERVEIAGQPGLLMKEINGFCSMVIESARYSRIHLQQRDCPSMTPIVELAKRLDYVRFSRKLGNESQENEQRREEGFFGTPSAKVSRDLPPEREETHEEPQHDAAGFVYN